MEEEPTVESKIAADTPSKQELRELRKAAVRDATATSDALATKMAEGYLLSSEEMDQMKACVATIEAATLDRLNAKLAQGHMLDADELAQLQTAAAGGSIISPRSKKAKPPPRRQPESPSASPREAAESGSPPWPPPESPAQHGVMAAEHVYTPADARKLYEQADAERRYRTQRILGSSSPRGARSETHTPRGGEPGTLNSRASPQREQLRVPQSPSQSRSARSVARPSPRKLVSTASPKELMQKVTEGHMLTEEEVRLLKRQAAAGATFDFEEPGEEQISDKIFEQVSPRPRSRSALPLLKQKQKQQAALAKLQINAMKLLADGLDIGDMRLVELIEFDAAKPGTLRNVASAGVDRSSRWPENTLGKGDQEQQRKASGTIQLYEAYGEAALPLGSPVRSP